MNTWFTKLIIQFFFSIDKIVFNLISEIYNLLITIARTSILTQSDIANMADKIYKLLAVFMVFKVTLSLITYIVNPDDFTDKSKGISKLGTNIIISLALLVLTPYVFSYAFELQTIILEDNSLAALFFENETDESDESDESKNNASILNTAGDQMAFITMSAFFKPNVSIDAFSECVDLYDENGGINSDCTGVTKSGEGSYSVTGGDGTMAQYLDTDDEKNMLLNYVVGLDNQNIGLMFRQKLATATEEINNKETVFLMDYKYIFSTVVGIVIILLLLTFCIDVGLRSIKLSFLQLIAPVPILSYIDPKSGKDGMFKKWYQMCFKTYLSLFIRLLAIYFAIYIIGRVGKMVDIVDGSTVTNLWVKIFVIIGALMFAKQFPEILKSLGIKLDGDGKFTLNPLKKFEEGALGGKRITGAVGGMVAGAIGGHGFNGRIGSMFTGAARGAVANKGYSGGLARQADVNRKLREARINGAGFWGSRAAVLSSRYGLDDVDLEREATQLREDKREVELASRRVEEKNKPLEARKKSIQADIAPAQSLIQKKERVKKSIDDMESFAVKQIEANKAGVVSEEYRNRKATHQYLTNNQGKALDFDVTINGKTYKALTPKLDEHGNQMYDADGKAIMENTIITPSMVADADNSVSYYLNKEGKRTVMNQLLEKKYHDKGAQALFDSKRVNYKADVENYNKEETDSAQHLKEFSTYDAIHGQADIVDISVNEKRNAIRDDEIEIEKIDREIKENQVNEKVDGMGVSLEEAQSQISAREKVLKDKQDKRKLNRELAKNSRIGNGS